MWRGTCWRIGLGGLCELCRSNLDFDMASQSLMKLLEISAPVLGIKGYKLARKCLNVSLNDACLFFFPACLRR